MNKQFKSFQHYVPRFLLDYFATDRLLWIYDRQLKIFRQQSPKSTAGEKAYYSFIGKGGKEHDVLESMFSAIEGYAAPIIKKLHNGRLEVSEQEKADLALFITALYLRGPDYFARVDDMSEQLSKEVMSRSAMFEPHFQKRMDEFEKKEGKKISAEERKQIQKAIVEKKYDLKFPKGHGLQMMMHSLKDIYNVISQMEWNILNPPKDKNFIISDNPAFTINIKPEGFYGSGLGLLVLNCESTAVLTPKVAIFLSQNHNPKTVYYTQITNPTVKNINFRVAVCSVRFVISNNEVLLKRIIERTHIEKRGSYARVKVS